MKKYNEFKYELGNDEQGNRAWINPVLVRAGVAMDERYANDLNNQFVNSGVKYEEVEEDLVKHIVTQEDLDKNPELAEHVKVGDEIFIPKPEAVEFAEAMNNGGIQVKAGDQPLPELNQIPEPPVIPAQEVVEATPEPVVIEETPAAPAPETNEGGN